MKWSLLIFLNLVWLALARVLVPLNRLFLEGAQPGRDGLECVTLLWLNWVKLKWFMQRNPSGTMIPESA